MHLSYFPLLFFFTSFLRHSLPPARNPWQFNSRLFSPFWIFFCPSVDYAFVTFFCQQTIVCCHTSLLVKTEVGLTDGARLYQTQWGKNLFTGNAIVLRLFTFLHSGEETYFLSLIKAGLIQWREGHCCRLDCNRQAIGTIYLAFLINFPDSFFLIRPENFCSFGKPQEALFVEFTWALMNGPAPLGRGKRFSKAIINLSRTQQLKHKKKVGRLSIF